MSRDNSRKSLQYQLTYNITYEPGATITLYSGGTAIDTTANPIVASANGEWSFTPIITCDHCSNNPFWKVSGCMHQKRQLSSSI